jgi:hypothetical protein
MQHKLGMKYGETSIIRFEYWDSLKKGACWRSFIEGPDVGCHQLMSHPDNLRWHSLALLTEPFALLESPRCHAAHLECNHYGMPSA